MSLPFLLTSINWTAISDSHSPAVGPLQRAPRLIANWISLVIPEELMEWNPSLAYYDSNGDRSESCRFEEGYSYCVSVEDRVHDDI